MNRGTTCSRGEPLDCDEPPCSLTDTVAARNKSESTIEKINRRRKKYGVNYSRCEPLQENGFDITAWSSDSAVWIRVQNKLFYTQKSNRVSIYIIG